MPTASGIRAFGLVLSLIGVALIAYGVIEAIDIANCADGGIADALRTCPEADFANVYGPIAVGLVADAIGLLMILGARWVPSIDTAEGRAAASNGLETLSRYRSSADGISSDGIRSKAAEVAASSSRSVWEAANRGGRPGGAAGAKGRSEDWETDPENIDPLSGRN